MNTVCVVRKYIGISARKMARLVSSCKGLPSAIVKTKMRFLPQKSAVEVIRAISNAEVAYSQLYKVALSGVDLFVKGIEINSGPSFSRIMPRARGSADVIKKRMCHIRVTLSN